MSITQVSYDPRSYERNFSNCLEKPEKFRASTLVSEHVISRYIAHEGLGRAGLSEHHATFGQRINFNMASPKHLGYMVSLDEAKRKCAERHSCFTRVESTEHVFLHPRYLGRLREGVKEELNSKLMKYSDVLQGVPVCYENFKILQRCGSILEELPDIHFDVKVDLIVFKPIIGSSLVGVVNNIGVDHVGCLIHNCFNASVSKSNFRNGLLYDSLDIGSEFTFTVIGTEAVNGVLAITGEVGEHKKRKRKHRDTDRTVNYGKDQSGHADEEDDISLQSLNGVNDIDRNMTSKSAKKRKNKIRTKE